MIHPTEMPNELQIARQAKLKPLDELAADMGIGEHLLESYGNALAKIKLESIEELSERPPAKYVVVSAITPTRLGEGKTTTTVGLGQAFKHIGKKAIVAVLVATVRALKAHSGRFEIVAGRPLPEELLEENPDDVYAGADNLRKQIENVRLHGVSPVVAINAFPTDHASEHAAIREVAEQMGARVAVCNHFSEGGAGAVELAQVVAEAAEEPTEFRFLYPKEASLREKIETIAKKAYGADGVAYDMKASEQLDSYEKNGFGYLPVCMAKTHLSISSDPSLKGAPKGWVLPVREVRASVGAGFIYPICGEMRTMPDLSATPAATHVDIDENGEIVGLS
jgi:formate--tetrahydrofolate ligase